MDCTLVSTLNLLLIFSVRPSEDDPKHGSPKTPRDESSNWRAARPKTVNNFELRLNDYCIQTEIRN